MLGAGAPMGSRADGMAERMHGCKGGGFESRASNAEEEVATRETRQLLFVNMSIWPALRCYPRLQ